MLVDGVVLVNGNLASVVSVQTVFGCNPNHPIAVLVYLVDKATGKSVICSKEFCLCVKW